MKIKSYAGGGINYLPVTQAQPEAETTSGSSESSKVPGFADKILDMVGAEGLDADVNTFVTRVQRTLDLAGDPKGENLSMREIMALTRQANLVKTNYKDYDAARKNLDTQQAWGDVALNSRGEIYVYNTESGNLTTVASSTYVKDPEKYIAVTNAELLDQRRSNSSLAYDNGILDDVYGAVGMSTITKYATDLINKFQKTEIEGVAYKKGTQIQSGLKEIVNKSLSGSGAAELLEAGPDGFYKIKESSTMGDTDINSAVNYIISSLPNNYKQTLMAKAAVEGFEPEAYLLAMVTGNTGRSISVDFDSSTSSTSGNGSGGNAQVQHTLAESYVDGQNLAIPQMFEIAPMGSTSTLVAYGNNAGPVVEEANGNPGKPLGTTNLTTLFQEAYGIRKVTSNTVVFGDQLISPDQIGGLVYNGSDMHRVVLPSKTINGGRDVVPDFELQEKLDTIVQKANDQGSDADTITRLLQEACPGAKYNAETGSIELPRERQHVFLTFGAVGAANFIDFDKDSKYLSKSEFNKDAYTEAVKYGDANHAKNAKKLVAGTADAGAFGTWFGGTKRNLYEGNVFLPVTSTVSGSSFYNQEYIPRSSYTNITGRAIENERQLEVQERLSNPENRNWIV